MLGDPEFVGVGGDVGRGDGVRDVRWRKLDGDFCGLLEGDRGAWRG